MKQAVFGLVKNEEQCRRIVDRLSSAGFSYEDISILYPQHETKTTTAETSAYPDKADKGGKLTIEQESKAPEGAVAGAVTGGVLGGSLGLLAGIGSIAIPGLGAFIAAGPIMAALGGSGLGGSLGLLLGALLGYGVPEYEAKKYETAIKKGNILISTHVDNQDEMNLATQIMEQEGAKDISSSSETTKSSY